MTLKLNPLVEYYESLGNEISNDSDVSLSVSLLSINKLENLIFLKFSNDENKNIYSHLILLFLQVIQYFSPNIQCSFINLTFQYTINISYLWFFLIFHRICKYDLYGFRYKPERNISTLNRFLMYINVLRSSMIKKKKWNITGKARQKVSIFSCLINKFRCKMFIPQRCLKKKKNDTRITRNMLYVYQFFKHGKQLQLHELNKCEIRDFSVHFVVHFYWN